jgi:hypothetical protein
MWRFSADHKGMGSRIFLRGGIEARAHTLNVKDVEREVAPSTHLMMVRGDGRVSRKSRTVAGCAANANRDEKSLARIGFELDDGAVDQA